MLVIHREIAPIHSKKHSNSLIVHRKIALIHSKLTSNSLVKHSKLHLFTRILLVIHVMFVKIFCFMMLIRTSTHENTQMRRGEDNLLGSVLNEPGDEA